MGDPKPADIKAGFTRCAELDALPPETLHHLVDDNIQSHIDFRVMRRTREIEQAERDVLLKFMQGFG